MMKILFTGGSSFTGFWFIRELAAAGHEVTAVFRRQAEEYADEVRRQRVALAAEACRPVYGCSLRRRAVPRPDQRREAGTSSATTPPTSPTTRAPTSTPSRPSGTTPTTCRPCSRPSGPPAAAECS